MSKLIEVTPQLFKPDYASHNPFDGETVRGEKILINIDYIKFIEGSCIVISIDQQDRFYSVFESYEDIKRLILDAKK